MGANIEKILVIPGEFAKIPVMNVLVVGGAGYIGSHCVRQLTAAGQLPVVLDNLVFGHREAVSPEIVFYEGDLGDSALIKEIFEREKTELVMHFAAFAYVGESVENPLKYYENNLAKPITLLKTMMDCGVGKFILSSTCAIYGNPAKLPIVEEMPLNPINPYGQTKLDLENVLKATANAHGLSFAAFRYFNAAGAAEDGSIGEDHDPETHLIPLVIRAALGQRENITIFGTGYPTPDGTCLRDYVHVDDLSRAHIAAIPKLAEPGQQLFYNLGTGQPHSVREVIATVEKVSGLKVTVQEGPRRPGDPPSLYADSGKAQKELNWKIQYPGLESIIATAWNWHKAHPVGYR